MRFSVLAEFFSGFAVLDDFFFGFAVSNRPQCPPHLGHTVIYLSKKVNLSWIFPFLVIKKISWTLLSDKKSSPNDGHF